MYYHELQDIIECDSAVCAAMPCHNGGVCNQVTIICQLSGVFLTNLSVLCQDPTGTSWFCSCAPGYTGPLCERQVCSANPCLHGGTCIGKWHTLY